jgi:hypothetical protein
MVASIGEYAEKLDPIHTVDRIVKWHDCLGKESGNSSKG